jgi:hypothetical protein
MLAACALAQRNGLHYVYVSSAGAYKANSVEPMHVEGDERKGSAGARAQGWAHAWLHPQAVLGPPLPLTAG